MPFSSTRLKDLARRGIGRRLAVYILAFSSIVTLLSTVLQLSLEYQRDVFDIEARLSQIEVSYGHSLASSLWVDSKNDVQLQLDGILRLPDMQFLEVVAEDNTVYGKVGTQKSTQVITREFPLNYTHRDKQVYLGKLLVVANLEGVYQRLKDKVLVILVTQTIKTFLVSLFILFLFQILVGRYLKTISAWSESLHADEMTRPLVLNRKETIHTADDELSQVSKAVNDMRMRLEASHKKLEDRVTDRTQQLVELNFTLSLQSEQLRALYETISRPGLSLDDQINTMLQHGCHFMGMEMAKVCQIDTAAGTNTFLYTYCEPGLTLKPGMRVNLDDSFCSIAVKNNEPTAISHVANSVYRNYRCYEFSHLESYIAAQVRIRGEVFGTVNFASRSPRALPFSDRDNDLLNLIGSWIGVTLERQFAQHELSVAKEAAEAASVAKSAFLANMSHEIRTPLTSIIGYADMSLQAGQTMQERIHALKTIHRSGAHLLRIINDVLDLSKIEAKKMEVEKTQCSLFELFDDVESLTRMKASEKGLDFVVSYQFPVPSQIETDSLRLKQVLVNLCGNAIKFTEQGHVRVNVSYSRINEQLSIEISDTGIGLTDEQAGLLFQEFRQADAKIHRKYGGTGLGLALSQHLATLLGGEISVVSRKGVGSIFTLTLAQQDNPQMLVHDKLQAVRANEAAAKFNPSAHADIRFDGCVLLVEDTDDLRVLIAMYLQRTGVTVVTAESGLRAIELIATQPFNLVLMDIQMPGMDGLTAMRQLHQSNISIPVVALTANAMTNDRALYREAGFADFLAKPIEPEQLHRVLKKYLARATLPRETEDRPIHTAVKEDDAVIQRVIKNFIDKLPSYHADLVRALDQRDWATIRKIVHDLKGLGGTMGYPRVSELATTMLFQIETESTEGMQQLIARLGHITTQIQKGARTPPMRLAHSAADPAV